MSVLAGVGLFTLTIIGFIAGYTANDIIRDDKRTIVRSISYMLIAMLIAVVTWGVVVNIMVQMGWY